MRSADTPLFERLRIFQSHDADEIRSFLGNKGYRFEVQPERAGGLDTRINGAYTPRLYIGYIQYGNAPVAFSPGLDRTDYWMQLPLRGKLDARLGEDAFACTPQRAVIASPRQDDWLFHSGPGNARIQVSLTGAALREQLAALIGEHPREPLWFAPSIDLTTGYGRSLARHVLAGAADLEETGSVLESPLAMSAFVEFITTALLLSHPHNHSAALQRPHVAIAPADVKRAINYIQAHLDSPLTITDIATASNVPGRTLFKHFKDWKGVSPMRYLRDARLARVRDALRAADAEQSITTIALRFGFTHMGRFALEYRRRFGESPSETLRKPRGARTSKTSS